MRVRTIAAILVLLMLPVCALAAQVLGEGDSGETVTVLTRQLLELGYLTQTYDEYGEETISAVLDFQKANGLAMTGEADMETQQVLRSGDAVSRESYAAAFFRAYEGAWLSVGDRGRDVTQLQEALKELGWYDQKADGVFGEGTRRAVEEYEEANGLYPDGTADAAVLLRLYCGTSLSREDRTELSCAAPGDSGARVRRIQRRLAQLGYYSGETAGTYGEQTTQAVRSFQRENGLSETGTVDRETCEALLFASDR